MISVPTRPITKESIDAAVQEACQVTCFRPFLQDQSCMIRRGTLEEALSTLHHNSIEQSKLVSSVNTAKQLRQSLVVVLATRAQQQSSSSDKIIGFAFMNLAYCTWDGRILYIHQLQVPPEFKECVLYTLTDIASRLECSRLTWQHYQDTSPLYKRLGAEFLDGWLTLRMDRDAIGNYLKRYNNLVTETTSNDEALGNSLPDGMMIESYIAQMLQTSAQQGDFSLSLATQSDLDVIQDLVHGLAVYEKEPESVHIDKTHYQVDGFETRPPWFYCLLLHSLTNETCGMAFFYLGQTLHDGPFLYLEDLFIYKEYRGKGGGTLLMKTLIQLSHALGCTAGMVWQALDWNTPALEFYDKLGAKIQEGLLTTRFAGPDKLQAFLEGRSGTTF